MQGPRKKEYFVKLKTILDKAKQTRRILFTAIAIEERPCNLWSVLTALKQGVVGFLRAVVRRIKANHCT